MLNTRPSRVKCWGLTLLAICAAIVAVQIGAWATGHGGLVDFLAPIAAMLGALITACAGYLFGWRAAQTEHRKTPTR